MPIFGALRIRNESRWIQRVIRSIKPACDRIFVLDDQSTDATPDICEAEGCTVFRSAVPWVMRKDGSVVSDESAGKQFLLERMWQAIPKEDQHFLQGNRSSPYWCLAIDGDEELAAGDATILRGAINQGCMHSFSLKILYLWDSPTQVRVDGVYRNFCRPSLFRLMNRNFRYRSTPFGNGANFHCSSIPQEMTGRSHPSAARLLHWGYIDRELRLKKYAWYTSLDPDNPAEDGYTHMILGDHPDFPATMKRRWGGPLQLEALNA